MTSSTTSDRVVTVKGIDRAVRVARGLAGRATIVFAVAAVIMAAYLYPAGSDLADACSSIDFGSHTDGGRLRIARSASGPWYDRAAPPISNQIGSVARSLYPGTSGRMIAYVKNTGSSLGAASISIADLTDAGGPYTEPERSIQPRGDRGDLSANIVLTITYANSQRLSDAPRVVAQGTLRDLAARGRVFTAPTALRPYTTRTPELGIWRIDLAVPRSADNRIQGDTSRCDFVFGLSQSR